MPDTVDHVLADIDRAAQLTAVRIGEDPSYVLYQTAQSELAAMRGSLTGTGRPDRKLQRNLTIGWLAVRELEGSDPEYERAN